MNLLVSDWNQKLWSAIALLYLVGIYDMIKQEVVGVTRRGSCLVCF